MNYILVKHWVRVKSINGPMMNYCLIYYSSLLFCFLYWRILGLWHVVFRASGHKKPCGPKWCWIWEVDFEAFVNIFLSSVSNTKTNKFQVSDMFDLWREIFLYDVEVQSREQSYPEALKQPTWPKLGQQAQGADRTVEVFSYYSTWHLWKTIKARQTKNYT